jgi:hypothetical protein
MLRGSAGSDINTCYDCLKTEESLFQKPVLEVKTTEIVQEINQYKTAYTGEYEKKVILSHLFGFEDRYSYVSKLHSVYSCITL